MRPARESLGVPLKSRILLFALYLLGLNRSAIGRTLGIPPCTAKSIIKAVMGHGLGTLKDRRQKSSILLAEQVSTEPPPITSREDDDHLVVDFGARQRALKLYRRDPLPMKTVLLSMFNSDLLSTRQAAEAIDLTPSHTAALARRLQKQGAISLLEQRQGQREDFLVASSVKAELIQQFAVDVITYGRTSSAAIYEKLDECCGIVVPDRTARRDPSRLGLGGIKRSLPRLVVAVKKLPTPLPNHVAQTSITIIHYDFSRPHGGLTQKWPDGKRVKRIPGMAGKLIDRVWPMRETFVHPLRANDIR